MTRFLKYVSPEYSYINVLNKIHYGDNENTH